MTAFGIHHLPPIAYRRSMAVLFTAVPPLICVTIRKPIPRVGGQQCRRGGSDQGGRPTGLCHTVLHWRVLSSHHYRQQYSVNMRTQSINSLGQSIAAMVAPEECGSVHREQSAKIPMTCITWGFHCSSSIVSAFEAKLDNSNSNDLLVSWSKQS